MGTSMLIERFHKRIKHEISDAKGNIRIDAFIEILITLFPFMEEMEYKEQYRQQYDKGPKTANRSDLPSAGSLPNPSPTRILKGCPRML